MEASLVPFEGARAMSREQREERKEYNRVPADFLTGPTGELKDGQDEDSGPVLSLPLEDSPEAEDGETAVFEKGVTFDGKGAVFSADSEFVVPNAGNIKGDAGTLSFSLEPQWGGGDEGDASLVQLRTPDVWENRLQIFKNGRYLRFLFTDNTGQERNIATTIDNWEPGQQHKITATWGEALQSFYVDGHLIGQQTYSGTLDVQPGTPLHIGSDIPNGGPSAGATISQFQVYNRALPPDQIGRLASRGAQ
ncbi:MAG: LamG domain-containing protein [Candidatus Binatia bacterium]